MTEKPAVPTGDAGRTISVWDRLMLMPILLLTLTALFWAGNAVAGRAAANEMPPLFLTFMRWVIVTAIMLPLFGRAVRAEWAVLRPRLLYLTLLAGLGFIGFNAFFYIAGYRTTAVNIGILQGSIPVLVLIGAFFAYGTRVGLVQLVGVAMTVIGVATVATKGAPQAILETAFNLGDLMVIAACALYAFYTVALQRRPAIDGRAFFASLAPIATVVAAPLAAVEAAMGNFFWPTTTGWLILLYVAVFPSCLAQIFFLRGVEMIGPGRAGVFVNLVPIFAAAMAVLLLGEPFAAYHAVALALVIGGIALAQRTSVIKPARTDG